MSHALWQFFIAESENMTRIADISLECRDKSFSLSLNRPGSFSFTMPLFTEWKSYLNPAEHCIIAAKNHNVVWSGPIWTKTEDFAEQKISLGAVGWFQELHERFLTLQDYTYSTTNDGTIAFNLLGIANAQEVESVARPTHITAGTNTSQHDITKTFSRWQNIGEEITNLTQIEAGFDFVIDPVTREMNIHAWDDYVDNTEAIFGFNFGPKNVTGVTRDTNAEDMHNQYFITGQYGTAEAHDVTSIEQFGLKQEVINVTEIKDVNILGAVANAELEVNKNPRIIINFDPKAEGFVENVPRFFEDYNLGDKVYLTAKRDGAEIINQGIRIFGIQFDIDINGMEKVSQLQTTAQGL